MPAAGAAAGDRGVFVSKGVGRQMFLGGGGVAYGTVFSGGSLVVMDYSPTHDLKVDSPVVATTNADGSRTFAPAGGAKSMVFRVSGTLYRVTVLGASTVQRLGVYGRLLVRGKSTLLRQRGSMRSERPRDQARQGAEGGLATCSSWRCPAHPRLRRRLPPLRDRPADHAIGHDRRLSSPRALTGRVARVGA